MTRLRRLRRCRAGSLNRASPRPLPSTAVPSGFPPDGCCASGVTTPKHAVESGGDPTREPPFFFDKPADSLVDSGSRVPYPPLTSNLHFEVELVVAIGIAGTHISPAKAFAHVFGYAVGIDLTRRDLQTAAIKAGLPWDFSKGFDQCAPCAPLHLWPRWGTVAGAHLARGERCDQAGRGSHRDDLARARHHCAGFRGHAPRARRP